MSLEKKPKKCPRCGFRRPRGRPKKLDDAVVWRLRKRFKWSLIRIAEQFSVTRGAVYTSIARTLIAQKAKTG